MQKNNKFIPFGAPIIGEAEIAEVVDSLRSGWIGTGPKVAKFENDFKSYKNAENAIAVNSCTAALHLSLVALGLQPGDEVITTPLTFCATVNSIIHAGGVPVLADVDALTMNITAESIADKITTKTKCILLVHFAGRPCEMDDICSLAKDKNLSIIEDCAHAIETEYKGKHAGTFGDFGCFSFYATKNIVTAEGGMILTNSQEGASKLRRLALHGMSKDAWKRFSSSGYQHYFVEDIGFKYNMSDLHAAIGIHQLIKIEEFWARRRYIWDYYNNELSNLPLTLPAPAGSDTKHAYHLYTVQVNENSKVSRDEFLQLMVNSGIGVGVHYVPIPAHPIYKTHFNWDLDLFPNAKSIGERTLSLPLSPKLTDYDIERVVNVVKGVF